MPPKKRKASSTAKASPAKKARTEPLTAELSNVAAGLSPSGRPKRASVSEPRYDFVQHRSRGRGRGRGRKVGRPSHAEMAAARATEVAVKKRPVSSSAASNASARNAATIATTSTILTPKKRGRPAKAKSEAEDVLSDGPNNPTTSTNTTSSPAATPRKRGRPPKTKPEAEDVSTDGSNKPTNLANATTNGEANGDPETVDPDIQYWLMKAEPESRIEKGHDVKFSIDDLMARTEPEPWDGVRNAAARNNMRAMRKGDLAFFYHSNCTVPGIAGVMRIVGEHTVDESAFDPDHPYYDPKSDRSKPKWEVVHVEFVKKFETLISLKELKSFAAPSGVLANMQMLKQGRLSVSSVTAAEWEFILNLAGEPLSLGHGASQDGYESDVDGEGEETAVDLDPDTDGAKEPARLET